MIFRRGLPFSRAARFGGALAGLMTALGAVSSIPEAARASDLANVDDARIVDNAKSGKEWPSTGLDYGVNRLSPLDQITTANVGKLGLAWSYALGSTRGVEATPVVVDGVMYVTTPWSKVAMLVVVDGVMYVTTPWSIVHAINARTGENIWTFDSQAPRGQGYKLCCDVVNRGVAVYKGKVYVGTPDARLIALDAKTGKPLWTVDASPDRTRPYTITGAPLVAKGKVFIGNGGAAAYFGVRGVISAFDAENRALAWRWYTVPGDPSKPFENEAMANAAKTWDDKYKYWENGGGRTVWNTLSADPNLNLLYFGTGNAGPWAASIRNPSDKDNLYTSSVVALDLDTGKYVWRFQETPADTWDYDADQDLILTDLTLDGQTRPVLLHAAKNGFFYVLDRKTGQFISARNFVDVNWASGYTADGRPIEIPGARGADKPVDAVPGPFGAHNWQSMAYSPKTVLLALYSGPERSFGHGR